MTQFNKTDFSLVRELRMMTKLEKRTVALRIADAAATDVVVARLVGCLVGLLGLLGVLAAIIVLDALIM